MEIRIAIIQYPGSNCEYETSRAVAKAGMIPEIFRWNKDPKILSEFSGYIIPGGFSYQDRVRAGAIAAKKSIVDSIMKEAMIGKPVLGICNGAQVLVEAGMIPGLAWGRLEMALAPNMMKGRIGFYCDWVYVKVSNTTNAFTRFFRKDEIFPIPIAHAEGRFVTKEEGLLEDLIKNNQIVLRYCDINGEIIEDFPINPNGSIYNIAGLCNPSGNVFALMPHPERAAVVRQIPDDLGGRFGKVRYRAWGNVAKMKKGASGLKIFESMRRYIEDGVWDRTIC
ncbi:MAG: phosphoribosylformylglycinamidine synthase I [bacterium]|nr:phosphoribosylformylglycinamidine synthase I [bacterium]